MSFRFATIALLLALVIAITGPYASAEQPALQLLTSDSLIGWDYAPDQRGWTNEQGRLSGSADSTPLLSGWTLGDFELEWKWNVRDNGAIKLSFPVVSPLKDRIADRYITPEWHLVLREGDSCGQLFDGTRLIAIGKQPVPSAEQHTAQLKRSGDELSLSVDGTPLWQVQVTDARLGLQLGVAEGTASVWDLTLREPAGESLFNGQDFTGWETDDPPEAWIVEDGQIVCTGKGRDYLRTIEDFGNFTLSMEYNLSRRGNSGIGIRTPRLGWPSGDGMELQLYDERPGTPLNRHSTMAIYGNLEPLTRAEEPEQWNHAVVRAEGYVISGWVNGVLAQHANTYRLPELKHRHLQGWVGLQNHRSPIRFRNIKLLRGADGQGPPAWYAPRTADASQVVLDRLMNSVRLSPADGVRSASIRKEVAQSGPVTLAELKGPGALVELAGLGESAALGGSQIKLYFDGEDSPRIECPLRDLDRRVPAVSEGGLPALMYLPYERSLRIELTAKGPAEYRLDYLTFPDDLQVETFSDREASVMRGLLPAISYRHGQMNSGRLRERDPYVLHESKPQTIEAGESFDILALDGAGVVDWWTLSNPRVVTNDDVWLEVTVDGESATAIHAPARYLFPGLGGGEKWHNFALTTSDGPTMRIAMPYADGIRIVAHNRGNSPVELGCTASVHPSANDAQQRLRGKYVPEKEAIDIEGSGRLVALICSAKEESSTELTLSVDGQSSADARQSLDLFLGLRSGGDQRGFLAGRDAGLAWRYLLLAPIDFAKSLRVEVGDADRSSSVLVLYYAEN